MSTSATDDKKKTAVNNAAVFAFAAVLCAAFCFIYEFNSHGVHSYYIEYASVGPIACSAVWLLLATSDRDIVLNRLFAFSLNASATTLALGGIVKGIIQLYGTDNGKLWIYYYLCSFLAVIAVVDFVISNIIYKRRKAIQGEETEQ